GQPVNTFTVTASNTTPGEAATSLPETITVTDPPSPSEAATPALGITWAGPSSQVAAGDPPDCNCAAGTSYIITVINSRIDIYSKTGTQLYDQTFQTFFNLPSNEFIFDPRVTWDQYSNRFIMTAGDENGGSSQAFLDIAVSKDSNPLDGWY